MILKKLAKFKKAIGFLLLICFLLPVLAKPILAYDSTPLGENPDLVEYYYDVFDPAIDASEMNLESFINETVKALIWGVPLYYITQTPIGVFYYAYICGFKFSRGEVGDAWTCLSSELPSYMWDLIRDFFSQGPETEVLAQNQENIFVFTFETVKRVSQASPISGLRFLEWFRQKLNPVSPVHAQTSFGFNSLESIIELWSNFRNVAYGLTALGLVIIGFMIMFRMKISPQAVVTIQTAIPKLIITLLIITFSYAIVGFLLDLTWVFTILFANIIGAQGIMDSLTSESVFGLFFDFSMWGRGLLMTFILLGSFFGWLCQTLVPFQIIPLIIFIALGIMIVIIAIKILWILIKAYVYIILYTVIGPVWIFLGILPGFNALGSWFRALLSQVVVFPTAATLLVLAHRFMPANLAELRDFLTSPTRANLPLMGGTSVGQAQAQAALGIIFLTPSLLKAVQAMVQKPLGLESAIGMPRSAGMYATQAGGYGLYRLGREGAGPLRRRLTSALKFIPGVGRAATDWERGTGVRGTGGATSDTH